MNDAFPLTFCSTRIAHGFIRKGWSNVLQYAWYWFLPITAALFAHVSVLSLCNVPWQSCHCSEPSINIQGRGIASSSVA